MELCRQPLGRDIVDRSQLVVLVVDSLNTTKADSRIQLETQTDSSMPVGIVTPENGAFPVIAEAQNADLIGLCFSEAAQGSAQVFAHAVQTKKLEGIVRFRESRNLQTPKPNTRNSVVR